MLGVKATVWTQPFGHEIKAKCIWIGYICAVPHVGDYLSLREDYGAERVISVLHDFVKQDVEITVQGHDPENSYGPCLFSCA